MDNNNITGKDIKSKGASLARSKAPWSTQIGCIFLGYSIFLTTFSLIKAMGIFFIQLQSEFGASATEASFTVSLPSAVVFIGGPAYGAVFNTIGVKPTYALAGLLMFTGFGGCFFASSLLYTQIFMGIIAGFGAGLSNVATLTLMGRAFYSSRPVALGALSMGGSTAAAISGPVMQLCIDSYTWRGALLLLGAYCLHGIALGFALEPLYTKIVTMRRDALVARVLAPPPIEHISKDPDEEDDYEVFEDTDVDQRVTNSRPSEPFVVSKRRDRRKSSVYDRFAALGTNVASVFDLTLLKDAWFICFCLSCGLSISSRILSGLYLVRYAQYAGINDQAAAMKLTVCETVSFLMTPIIGFITSVKKETSHRKESATILCLRKIFSSVKRSYLLSIFQILMFVVIAVSTTFKTNEEFVAYAAMLGFCYGGITSMLNVVLADLFGTRRLAGAFGYRSLASGVMFLGAPPLIGYLIDTTGTYKVAQYCTSVMTLIAGILTGLTQFALQRRNRQLNNNNEV